MTVPFTLPQVPSIAKTLGVMCTRILMLQEHMSYGWPPKYCLINIQGI